MNIRHIAVGIDLSNDARKAAAWGAAISRHLRVPLTLINVVESSKRLKLLTRSEEVEATIREQRARAAERLTILAEDVGGAKVKTMLRTARSLTR